MNDYSQIMRRDRAEARPRYTRRMRTLWTMLIALAYAANARRRRDGVVEARQDAVPLHRRQLAA
jgi:hypothetical protein